MRDYAIASTANQPQKAFLLNIYGVFTESCGVKLSCEIKTLRDWGAMLEIRIQITEKQEIAP